MKYGCQHQHCQHHHHYTGLHTSSSLGPPLWLKSSRTYSPKEIADDVPLHKKSNGYAFRLFSSSDIKLLNVISLNMGS